MLLKMDLARRTFSGKENSMVIARFKRQLISVMLPVLAALGGALMTTSPASSNEPHAYTVDVDEACRSQNNNDPLVKSKHEDFYNPYT